MFSEFCDTKDNDDIFLTNGLDGDGEDSQEEQKGEKTPEGENPDHENPDHENSYDKKIDKKNLDNLETAKNKANEWYKVLSNAYPTGFEINKNGNESTKVLLSKSSSGTDFSIKVSRIEKEGNEEREIESGVLNFENMFTQNSDSQEMGQGSTVQKDTNLKPSFSITGNIAILSQLFNNQEGQNNEGLDLANQDFCSIVDALGSGESIIRKEIDSVYGYVHNYLEKFRNNYNDTNNDNNIEHLETDSNDFDKKDIIDFILSYDGQDKSSVISSLFIKKALISSCILLRSSGNNNQGREVSQALGIIDKIQPSTQTGEKSITSGEELIELLTGNNQTGNIAYIISNLDILVEGAISCPGGDILNNLNNQND